MREDLDDEQSEYGVPKVATYPTQDIWMMHNKIVYCPYHSQASSWTWNTSPPAPQAVGRAWEA